MAAHFLRVPYIIEGGTIVLPGVDLVIVRAGDDVQIAVPVQIPHRYRPHPVRMAAHFLLGPGPVAEGGAIILPGVDLVIIAAGDDVQIAVPVQVPHRYRPRPPRVAAHVRGGALEFDSLAADGRGGSHGGAR